MMDKTARDEYRLTGPLGKGLGLSPQSKGTFLAFSAGTGVLVFIDMIAKLVLQTLDILPAEDERFDDDFKLVFFASFKSRKDGIALPLLEGLSKLVNKKGISHRFKLQLKFSNEGS